ncbi:MAG: hypothetical protein DWQ07_01365 [Chloroflexi bacterium]|nr:MAG: hypothetical protein DWQ07_01365 [Chloroflexota bacterium]MBL1193854.1 hypothetical protein [Chloroflexota bacterium]NOH11148.1 hypothetical protein [Chloroflexota bacterium]
MRRLHSLIIIVFNLIFLSGCSAPSLFSPVPSEIEGILSPENPQFVVRFNTQMDNESVEAAASIQPATSMDFSWDDRTVTVDLTGDLIPGQRYEFKISEAAMSSEGIALQPIYKTYTTEPLAVDLVDHSEADHTALFRLKFNYPVDREQTAEALSIQPKLAYTLDWINDQEVDLVADEPVGFDQSFEVFLSRRARSSHGVRLLESNEWHYTSPALAIEFDELATNADDGNQQFRISFSHSIDTSAADVTIDTNPELPLNERWNASGTELILSPVQVLERATRYHFNIRVESTDDNPYPFDTRLFVQHFESPPLQVEMDWESEPLSHTPPLLISFNYPMDTKSVEQALSFSPSFAYTVTWNSNATQAIIDPQEALPANSTIDASLAVGARDASGIPLGKERSQQLATLEAQVTLSAPYNYDSTKPFELTFTIPMDPQSVEEQIVVEPHFDFELEWRANNTIAKIVPENKLYAAEDYTLHFEHPPLDAQGYAFEGRQFFSWRSPSPVDHIDPWNYGIELDQSVVINFAQPMDADSITPTLQLVPDVGATFTWLSDRELEIAPPDGLWPPHLSYSLYLSPESRYTNGDPVVREDYRIVFSSQYSQPLFTFGEEGSNVQVLDASGRRALRFGSSFGGELDATIEFHQLSIDKYLSLYNTYQPSSAFSRRRHPAYYLENAAFIGSWSLSEELLGETGGELIIPDDIPRGLYVISGLVEGVIQDQLLLVLTDTTIAAKYGGLNRGGGQVTAWVSNINDFVMPQTRISVYDRDGNILTTGETDELGIFKGDIPEGTVAKLVVARRAGDISLTHLGDRLWRTTGTYPPRGMQAKYFSFTYTDRPIYQPNQTVNFKSIVRLDNDADYKLPPDGLEIDLVIRDPRKNIVHREEGVLNEFGTIHGTFSIADGAMLGTYSIELEIEGATYSQFFKVQEYKKPDMAIEVQSNADVYVVGDTARFDVNLNYLFGEPVPDASVTVKWYELITCYYCADPIFSDSSQYRWLPSDVKQFVRTDSAGYASFEKSAPIGDGVSYYDYDLSTLWGVEVTADDGSDQFVSTFTTVRVYKQDTTLSIQTDRYLYQPDNPIPVSVVLSPVLDATVSNREVTVNLTRWDRGLGDYKTDETYTLMTNADGLAEVDLKGIENGFYKLQAAAEDSQGNRIRTSRYLYVHDFVRPWYSDFGGTLQMRAELGEVSQGDTAQIIVESSFDGEALLTIERGKVLEERIVTLEAPFTVLDIPIQSNYAPNVYVVLQAWRAQDTTPGGEYGNYGTPADSKLAVDYLRIDVPDTENELTIEITPDQEIYGPRDEANFTLRVTDHWGKPVEAELSLALIDEAIFLLADDPAGPIHDSFYSPRALGVYWYDSMSPWRLLYTGDRGGGGSEAFPFTAPRSDFPDTVVWLPSVVTDANGEATLDITLPDTLTSWRLTARAINKAAAVGDQSINVLTQKPVVVRPLPPRSLVEGDQLTFSAIIHNFSEKDANFDVSAVSGGLLIQDEHSQSISIAAGKSQVVVWQAEASAVGDIDIQVSASSSTGRDDIVISVPVAPMAVQTAATQAGTFTGELSAQIEVPPDLHAISQIELEINSSIAGNVLSGVEYLTGYPYGCVEQVMSRALPNAVVGRAFDSLGLVDRQASVGLEGKVEASIQRLNALQHVDGGWGWWYDDRSDAYQTAWVLFGLSTISEAGYMVDPNVLGDGSQWLSEHLNEMDPRTRAFALYSMAQAGLGDLEASQQLAAQSEGLDVFAMATLVVTLQTLGDEAQAQALWDLIVAEVQTGNDRAWWGLGGMDGYYRSKTMASDVRTTAMVLIAMLQVDPNSELLEPAVDWLMSKRQRYGWGTTNETAFSILALTDYLLYTRQSAANTAFTVFIDDQEVASGEFSEDQLSHSISIPADELTVGMHDIRIEGDQDTFLYYVLTNDFYQQETRIAADGILVAREFLDPETREPLKTIKEGQLVLVQLSVEVPKDTWYVMVEDFLPGGLEALNEGLNSTSHEVLTGIADDYPDLDSTFGIRRFFWQDHGYNFKEIRHDRVIFFITSPRPGLRTYRYMARAISPGTFIAKPAQISAMYDPLIWGYSNSDEVRIEGK